MNILFRLITGRPANAAHEGYVRVCFEDWAYWGGSMGTNIQWGGWVGGLALTLTYAALLVLIPVGFIVHQTVVGLVALGGLLLYHLIRTLTPEGH